MIFLKTLAATALVTGLACSTASFASIGPAGTPFSATGTVTISIMGGMLSNIACNANFVGSTHNDGTASITSATFSGTNSICGSYTLGNLPWTLTNAGNTIAIANFYFSGALGSCGPANVNTSWNVSASSLTIPTTTMPGIMAFTPPAAYSCTISGTLAVQPALTVQ